ncbi:hypothetical protein AVP43_02356 [Geobacillus stearothermophilus]|nr:hypothetical protein AVP43_02356 [Geobacillus stearothermophilus]
MKRKILVIDTSILCCWLQIPGKETCGSQGNMWNYERVNDLLTDEEHQGATFVLPLATIIETGNHIVQAAKDRYEYAQKLVRIIQKALDKESPWAQFSEQAELWKADELHKLIAEWPQQANQRLSIGDSTIKSVADYYAKVSGWEVEILTGDEGLKAYEPAKPTRVPRRRR